MAIIERIKIIMVDLKPEAVRSDTIQSFVSQETPIVRIFDADGAIGTGDSYTIGTGGRAVVDLLQRHLAPILIGKDATTELHVSLVAAIPNGRWAEYIPQLTDITENAMCIEDGKAVPSSKPGLGIDWDWAKINKTKICHYTI